MRDRKTLPIIIVLLIFFSAFISLNVRSDEVENSISSRFDITFETATYLKVKVTMDVNKITLEGAKKKTYTDSEISSIAENDLIKLGTIIQQINIDLSEQITSTFPDTNIDSPYDIPYYEDELFKNEYTINLTNNFFGLNESIDTSDFINGLINMGAVVNFSFNLNAHEGWLNTYSMSMNSPLLRHYTNGEETANTIRWIVDNINGVTPVSLAELHIKHQKYDSLRLVNEDIEIDLSIDTTNIDTNGFSCCIIGKNLDISNYNILPSFVDKINYVPSDGIRLFVENGLISWDEFYSLSYEKIKDEIIPIIENDPSFNQTLDLDFKWDIETTTDIEIPYNLSNMANITPIRGDLVDNDIIFEIFDISSRAVFGLVNAGAETNLSSQDLNFGQSLSDIKYPYIVKIMLPDGFYIDNKNIYEWDKEEITSGLIETDYNNSFSESIVKKIVEIEFTSSDLNLLSIFTGVTELNFGVSIQEISNYSVTKIPIEFSIPEEIKLDYLCADAFKLCVLENVFLEESVNDFLENEKDLFEKRLENVFNDEIEVEGIIDKTVFEKTTQNWDGNIYDMGYEKPVSVKSYSHTSYTVPFRLSIIPPEFEINEKRFNVSGIQDEEITYRIIYPSGTSLDVEDSLNKINSYQMNDGRNIIELTFGKDEYNKKDEIKCKMIPSPLYLIGIFIPCILSIFIIIILIIVVYLIRKKRRGGTGRLKIPDEEEISGYENEDYYIPPPPGGKE